MNFLEKTARGVFLSAAFPILDETTVHPGEPPRRRSTEETHMKARDRDAESDRAGLRNIH
jgi:hypothetical protein